jgi:hypothetical protein
MTDAEAVLLEGIWLVAHRSPGAPTDFCSAQQARDRARLAEDQGDAKLAGQLREAAADVEKRNAQLGPQ